MKPNFEELIFSMLDEIDIADLSKWNGKNAPSKYSIIERYFEKIDREGYQRGMAHIMKQYIELEGQESQKKQG